MSERPPVWSVALVSCAALANEILLTRFFAIVHWHHFAQMLISMALLGFGASGTFLTVARRRLLDRFERVYVANLLLFGVLALAAPLAASALPFQAEQLLWDPWQPAWLAATYLLPALPFFCAANAIGLALLNWRARINTVYAADLVGAGVGSLAILAVLYTLPPELALKLVGCTGVVAAYVALVEMQSRYRPAYVACAITVFVLACVPSACLRPEPGPYKALSQALRIDGTRVIAERSSPLGRIDVVESALVPLRHAPGLSLMAAGEPPPQLGLFTDGDQMQAITAGTADPGRLVFLGATTEALAYRIAAPQSVFVPGAGGGLEILRAQHFGARRIEGAERDARVADLLRRDFHDYTAGLIAQPGVELVVGDARGVLASHSRRYDLIQMSLLGSAAGGVAGLNEDYLQTVEAFGLYFSRLNPRGYLSVTGYVQVPPRDGLKALATAIVALERAGVQQPARQLLMIRSWQTFTLLVKNGQVTVDEIRRMREFCDAFAFDVVWFPGMPHALANVYNQLEQPWFEVGARALLGPGRARFTADYAFDIRPATDDRPFFQNYFRGSTFSAAWQSRDRGGMALLEAGYPVLAATVAQALLAGGLLILSPLALLRRRRAASGGYGRVFAYFACIGLAFLFVEVAFLQKLMRFVHHPTVALALTLATFLLAAGAGTVWAGRDAHDGGASRRLGIAVVGIVVLGLLHSVAFDPLLTRVDRWPMVPKVAIAVASIAPLAFLMGAPFPLVLRELEAPLVPWAWGINGCASVVSPVLATLLAVHAGFTVVLWLAIALYALSFAVRSVYPGRRRLPAHMDARNLA
jgi:hypothetical protein